jgi:hypothetical protein
VHVAFYATFPNSPFNPYNYLYYSRTADGATWSAPEILRTSVSTNLNPTVSPVLLELAAHTYDGALAVLDSNGPSIARRCGPPDPQGWPTTTLAAPNGLAYALPAVNEVGFASLWMNPTTGPAVVQHK